jgi:hypothetical protein
LAAKKIIRDELKKGDVEKALEGLIEHMSTTSNKQAVSNINTGQFIAKFKEEYKYTFDGIHCSDPVDAEKELGLFFNNDELQFKDISKQCMAEIVLQKISALNVSVNVNSNSSHGFFSRVTP